MDQKQQEAGMTAPPAQPANNPYGGQTYGYEQQPQPQQAGVPPPGPPAYGAPQYGQQPPPGQYYGQPAPMQQQQMQSNNTVVVTGQPAAPANVIIHTQIYPQNYLVFAIFVTLCCNLALGIVAIVFSMLSSSDADAGDLEGARTKGRISMWISIAGIVSAVIIIIIVIVVMVTRVNKVIDASNINYGK